MPPLVSYFAQSLALGKSRPPFPVDARANAIVTAALALSVAFVALVFLLTGIGPAWESMQALIVFGSGMAAGYWFAVRQRLERAAALLRALGELVTVFIAIGLLSYAGGSLAMPLRDEWYHAWDQVLGFNWIFWLGVLNEHPAINQFLVLAYHSMLFQTVGLVVVLALTLKYCALNQFILAYFLSAVVTVIIAAAFPAMSPLVHYGLTPADYPNITLAVPLEFQVHALAMRDGNMRLIDLGTAQGLVTFPSFHTVSAILLVFGFWRIPLARWPALLLNIVMLIAIPIEGSHYLVDVIAGVLVAVLAWYGAGMLIGQDARFRGWLGGLVGFIMKRFAFLVGR